MHDYYTWPSPPFINGGTVPSTAAEIPRDNSSSSSSITIIIIVIASAIIASATIYLLIRLLNHRFRRTADDAGTSNRVSPQLLESLPLFSFGSVTGNLSAVDCAVCLSTFEKHDQLRLLPLCCHAFHRDCIDTWLVANQTCPLCRSDVNDRVLNKALNSGSFRLEMGSISRRRETEGGRSSYSIGSFEYVVEEGQELSIHRSGVESLTAEVSRGRSWLRDYVDRMSSGRFFSGSSRRSDVIVPVDNDLEAGRAGEEITELFRWFSGV